MQHRSALKAERRDRISPVITALLTAGIVSGLAGCAGNLASGPTVDAGTPRAAPEVATAQAPQSSQPGPQGSLADLARMHAANPRETPVVQAYVRGLKASGKRPEALAVLDSAVEADPENHQIKVEHGLLALELGQTDKAQTSLKKAAAGATGDWRVLSGLGVASSSQGRQKEAQRHFAKALELSPNNPAVLNNMAMSLILERKIDQAEVLLRRAAKGGAPPQQLALNLALAQELKNERGAQVAEAGPSNSAGVERAMNLGGPVPRR